MGWPSRTACSCTGRRAGPARCGRPRARSRSSPRASGCSRRGSSSRSCAGRFGCAEAFAFIPELRRRLPEARLPFERPAVLAATAASAVTVQVVRRSDRLGSSSLGGAARELLAGTLSLAPALLALRGGELAAYHGAEHVSIGSYEHGERRAKEHERCGSHLIGPLLAASAVGERARLARAALRSRPCPDRGVDRRCRRCRRGLRLDDAAPGASTREGARAARPRAAAPDRHRRAFGRPARGGRGSARRVSGAGRWRRRKLLGSGSHPEVFDLPVEKMREGYYTDAYFNHTRDALLADGRRPRVVMQVFQREEAMLGGRRRGDRRAQALLARLGGADGARALRRRPRSGPGRPC